MDVARERNLEKLQAHVIEDDAGALRMLDAVGFKQGAVLKDPVKDTKGEVRNLLVLQNDVADLSRLMEAWIQDSMITALRVPGAGA